MSVRLPAKLTDENHRNVDVELVVSVEKRRKGRPARLRLQIVNAGDWQATVELREPDFVELQRTLIAAVVESLTRTSLDS